MTEKDKKDYLEHLQEQIAETKSHIATLQEKTGMLAGDVKQQYQKRITKMNEQLEDVKQKFREFHSASSEAKSDLKIGIKNAITNLKESAAAALSEFR